MDFLEAAVILIPALTGIEVTVYSGNLDVLEKFERRFCFSPQLQRIYSAAGLEEFLDNGSGDLFYDIVEPLGSCLIAFRMGESWVLLGPFVEEGWNGGAARALLAKAGASEAVVMPFKAYRCKLPVAQRHHALDAARLVAAHTGGSAPREVRTVCIQAEAGDALSYPSDYEDSAVVNRRYALEDQFFQAIVRGDHGMAHRALREMSEVAADLRFVTDEFRDRLALGASMRTILRLAAKQAGLSPVQIDSISQGYAQKMQHATSNEELYSLMLQVMEHFCAEIRKQRQNNYSPCVKLAMDYMNANLSRQMTVTEIARAAGVDRHRLTDLFGRETGMTVKQYLAKQRCGIAADLLKSCGASVQEIAAYVGYSDGNYFSRVFKSFQGATPQDYRKSRAPFIPLD